jgi:hypothetical protein
MGRERAAEMINTSVLEAKIAHTSNTSQKPGCAATSYAIQRILRLPLVCNDGFGGSERCTHGGWAGRKDNR